MEAVVLLYASNRRLEGWGSLDVGGPVELLIWRSVSSLETAPMWVSPTQYGPKAIAERDRFASVFLKGSNLLRAQITSETVYFCCVFAIFFEFFYIPRCFKAFLLFNR
jgi:hypothetical protein